MKNIATSITLKNDFIVQRKLRRTRVRVMVLRATFSNISVIIWRSVLLVEETGENHPNAACH
jgi:hypothetical protein